METGQLAFSRRRPSHDRLAESPGLPAPAREGNATRENLKCKE